MTRVVLAVALGASVSLSVFPSHFSSEALAQDATAAPIEFVVTPGRSPQSIQRTGSAVSVVTRRDIEQLNPTTMVDVLRNVPGLHITETGGPGGTANVRLRGANSGQTLVLIDGARVNDPSGASGEFDFSMISPAMIERIEVLRGPQSALYGSDAIGGVINIITKRGRGPMTIATQVEAGSYGTISGAANLFGGSGPWSYAFGVNAARSDGFSTYGYRIRRIEALFPNLEADGMSRFGGFGRIGYDPGNGFRMEIAGLTAITHADYDAAFGAFPDTPDRAERRLYQGSVRAELDTLGGRLTHSLEVFGNRNDRTFRQERAPFGGTLANPNITRDDFIGDRYGVEYQGILGLDRFGSLTAGARIETETGKTYAERIRPHPTPRRNTLDAKQTTRSVFGLWQLPVTDRFDLSFGGRIDDVVGVETFATWRTTAAYRIDETGTKLRASIGTGGKAPTLFQLFSPLYGNASLQSERSLGIDAGFDQTFMEGRALLSVTGFYNRLNNLIGFENGGYVNVARARTYGAEVALDAELWPEYLRLRVAYTYLIGTDQLTGKRLARRPEHAGRIGLAITPTLKWTIEPSVTFVSSQYNSGGETGKLHPWARLDIATSYRFNNSVEAYARVENVTDARYEETLNYGTSGRAFYAGLKAVW
ncbi:MAG TPA: TonB-dependent receptor [Saliniramus sp.]|nr:TonB-dependent receptor [Saliniramus sp.]